MNFPLALLGVMTFTPWGKHKLKLSFHFVVVGKHHIPAKGLNTMSSIAFLGDMFEFNISGGVKLKNGTLAKRPQFAMKCHRN